MFKTLLIESEPSFFPTVISSPYIPERCVLILGHLKKVHKVSRIVSILSHNIRDSDFKKSCVRENSLFFRLLSSRNRQTCLRDEILSYFMILTSF